MPGLRNICKLYGGLRVKRADGRTDEWIWDYKQDRPRLKSEMDAEAQAASERRKYARLQAAIEKKTQGELFREKAPVAGSPRRGR